MKGKIGKGFNKVGETKKYSPYYHCKKGHTVQFYQYRSNVQCRSHKQLQQVEKMCKNKGD